MIYILQILIRENGNINDCIDILVGADYYWDIVIGDVIHGSNSPTAVSSRLGWLLSGRSRGPQSDGNTFSNLIIAGERLDNSRVASNDDDEDELVTSLKRFWELESIGIKSNVTESENPPKEQDFCP